MLELNHRHSKARFRAGVHLLKGLMDEVSIQAGFDRILQAAHMRRHNNRGDRYGYGPGPETVSDAYNSGHLRNRKVSRGGVNEKMTCEADISMNSMNHITSLLSPTNLKNIERKNLYQKQLNSFYAPSNKDGGAAGIASLNNSAVVPDVSRRLTVNDMCNVSTQPLIQLQASEVVKEIDSSRLEQLMNPSTRDQSRYVATATQALQRSSNSFFPATLLNTQGTGVSLK